MKKVVENDRPLTDKQKRFCDEYLIDYNATAAAKRAGYSEKTANEYASQLLSFTKISDYLAERKAKLDKKLEDKYLVSKDRVLGEYARISFSDIRAYFDEDGAIKSLGSLAIDEAAAIASIESFEVIGPEGMIMGTNKKLKVWDKLRGLEGIRKMLGYDAPIQKDLTSKGESINNGFFQFLQSVNQVSEE